MRQGRRAGADVHLIWVQSLGMGVVGRGVVLGFEFRRVWGCMEGSGDVSTQPRSHAVA